MLNLRRGVRVLLGMVCAAICAGLPGLPAAAQTNFNSVVVFGDSLSDTGNIANLTQSQFKIRFPADNTLLGFDYTDGRFTDGTDTQPAASQAYAGVWVEQLAALFGGKVTIKDSLDGGTDYAYGDATTADGTTVETRSFGGLSVSLTLDNMGQQVTNYLGTTPAPNPQTLYVLWGGANDLLNAAEAGQDPVAAATIAANNEVALVQRLYAAGATNFLLPNLPPLGAFAASAGPAAVTSLNTASVVFAQTLATGLATLQQGAMNSSLHVYQPDILTLFATVAANPASVGLGDITTAADTVKVSPDTYLIWDGLHPTTTGHHLIAATAANLLSAQVTSSVALTVPAAAIVGQAITVSAAVTSSQSGTVPTGLVTFFNGATVAGSAALDAKGNATLTFTPAAVAGNYALSAVYAGDVVNAGSASAAKTFPLLSAAVSTTTVVSSSNLNADLGASVTFTAAVTPAVATYGVAAGTVTFLDGTTTLGTGTLDANGNATYSTSSLTAGTHTITAVYAAAGAFGGSTSAAITETVTAPTFTAAVTPSTLTISNGASGTVSLSATSVAGFSSNVTVSCGPLPAHFACSFDNTTLSFASGATTSNTATLTISTNAASTTPSPTPATMHAGLSGGSRVLRAGIVLPAAVVLLGLGLRRRRKLLGGAWLPLGLAVLATSALLGLAGCGSSNNAPAGTYTVPVVFTPASSASAASVRSHLAVAGTQTVNVTVTVQ